MLHFLLLIFLMVVIVVEEEIKGDVYFHVSEYIKSSLHKCTITMPVPTVPRQSTVITCIRILMMTYASAIPLARRRWWIGRFEEWESANLSSSLSAYSHWNCQTMRKSQTHTSLLRERNHAIDWCTLHSSARIADPEVQYNLHHIIKSIKVHGAASLSLPLSNNREARV